MNAARRYPFLPLYHVFGYEKQYLAVLTHQIIIFLTFELIFMIKTYIYFKTLCFYFACGVSP